jgi:hypothetical protein
MYCTSRSTCGSVARSNFHEALWWGEGKNYGIRRVGPKAFVIKLMRNKYKRLCIKNYTVAVRVHQLYYSDI